MTWPTPCAQRHRCKERKASASPATAAPPVSQMPKPTACRCMPPCWTISTNSRRTRYQSTNLTSEKLSGRRSAYVFTSARPQPGKPKTDAFTIDIHCRHIQEATEIAEPHFKPEMEPAILFTNEMTREVNMQQNVDRMPHLTTVDHRLIDMDAMGIDLQTIIPPPFQAYYWLPPEICMQASEIVNNGLAKSSTTCPIVSSPSALSPNDAMAVAELERGVTKLGLKGFQILTNVNGSEISDPRLDKFWAKAQDWGTLIFIHPNGFTSAERFKDHYFSNVIGNPLETTIAVHRLIFDGVMERFRTRILLAHGGGYLPAYAGRIGHVYKGARMDASISTGSRLAIRRKCGWIRSCSRRTS